MHRGLIQLFVPRSSPELSISIQFSISKYGIYSGRRKPVSSYAIVMFHLAFDLMQRKTRNGEFPNIIIAVTFIRIIQQKTPLNAMANAA